MRCSSAFFSSASLLSTSRMTSCSSSVRKLRSIMVAAARLATRWTCVDRVNSSPQSHFFRFLSRGHTIRHGHCGPMLPCFNGYHLIRVPTQHPSTSAEASWQTRGLQQLMTELFNRRFGPSSSEVNCDRDLSFSHIIISYQPCLNTSVLNQLCFDRLSLQILIWTHLERLNAHFPSGSASAAV